MNLSLPVYVPEADGTMSSGLVITEDDVRIFRLIHQHRFLRRDQLSILTGRPAKRLHRRLHALAERRFLSVLRLPLQKHIYGLGTGAVPVLVARGFADPEMLEARLRIHELRRLAKVIQ